MEGYEKSYHDTVHDSLVFNDEYYIKRAKLAQMKYFSNIPKETKILEFGCGLGQDIYLFPNGVGYDISQYCLDLCKKRGIKVIHDLDEIEDKSFDIVYSAHTLEHVINPHEVILQMKAKLKDNGKLMLILPTERLRKASFELDTNQHLYSWNFRTINNLLIKSGFDILENKYYRGIGYDKLLFASRLSINFYRWLTYLTAFLCGIKEMMIIAKKK